MMRTGLLPFILYLFVVAAGASSASTAVTTNNNTPPPKNQDLLKGYKLLGDILGGESTLWTLKFLRRLSPFTSNMVNEIRDYADKISDSGARRKKELVELRKLSPDVTGKPIRGEKDPLGAAIGDVAKWQIIGNMVHPGKRFNLNFAVLQISATRMISATAKALSTLEDHAERKAWLKDVAAEYANLAEDVYDIISKYVHNEGSDQPLLEKAK